jgi:AAHS family benzoate transporter-like MFS transporter
MRPVLVNEVIGSAKMNKYLWVIFVICALSALCDGYDGTIVAVVLPSVMSEWHLTPIQAGMLGSWGFAGMILGSLVFGPVADKFGKSRALMLATFWYAVCSVGVGASRGFTSFAVWRFISGIGLAGAYPVAIAFASEYAPKAIRSRVVVGVAGAMPAGGVAVMLVGLAMMGYSWRTMFYLGAIPILLVFAQATLPESMSFYLQRGAKSKIANVLARTNPAFVPTPEDEYQFDSFHNTKASVRTLFARGLAANTILFWLMMFLNYNFMYGIPTWLPKLMNMLGWSRHDSLLLTFTYMAGFILGIPVYGYLQDRLGSKRTLQICMVILVILASVIGFVKAPGLLAVLLFLCGAHHHGMGGVAGSYIAQSYPLPIRATGTAWGYGLGRLGATTGPIITGLLLTYHAPIYMAFIAFAVIQIVSLIVASFTTDYTRGDSAEKLAKLGAHA